MGMKTAISIPDPIFEEAERLSKRLGVSRSEFYAKAVADYLELNSRHGVTAAIDKIYADEPSGLDPALWYMQLSSLSQEQEKW